jgi:hypothetical protein
MGILTSMNVCVAMSQLSVIEACYAVSELTAQLGHVGGHKIHREDVS